MSKDWIDRYTCDRCGERVEQLHSDEKWPEGWKHVGVTGDAQRLICPACMGFVRAALAAQSEETPRPDSAQTDWGETRRAR